MALNGIFSYFPTEVPTKKDLEECEDVLILTPVTPWNPNDTAYSKNEEAMLDHEGNMTRIEDRMKFILSEIQEDATLSSTRAISAVESKMIDNIFGEKEACYIGHYSPTNKKSMDPRELCCLMAEMHLDSHFKASVGATYPSNSKYLCEDEDDDTVVIDDNYNSEDHEDDMDLPELVDKTYDSDSSDDESDNDDDSVSPSITSHENNDDESYDWCQDDLIEIERLFKDEKAQEAFMASAAHASKPKNFDAEHLSKVWRIDLPMAKRTVDSTSQHCIRTKDATLSKNFSTNDRMLRYKRLNLYYFMDTFFATSKGGRSSRGHTCVQLFVTDKGYIYVIPMKKKSDVLQAVKQFAKEVGAPTAIICDAAREQTSSALKQFCNGMGTTLRVLEEGTPWANKAELYIGLVKEAVRKDMKDSNCPIPFWDYCLERRARINNLLAKDLFQLHGTNAHFSVTGEEGDISNLAQFGFYEWCYFRDHTQKFPFNQEVLGKVLGPASGEGNEMSQWILKINGRVVPRRTVRPLTVAEQHNLEEKKKRKFFEVLIEGKYGSAINPPRTNKPTRRSTRNSKSDVNNDFIEYEDEEETPQLIPEIEEAVDATGQLLNLNPAWDSLINAEIQLQHNDKVQVGKVTKRAIGPDGTIGGTYDENPRLNSMVYEVEFPDGQVKEYAANVLAENILSQVDSEGFSTVLFDGIVDYKKDTSAVALADKFVVTRRGQRRLKQTTKGWSLLVAWKDGSETWIPLRVLKESNPVDVAEFARAKGIQDEPAFAWWVPYVLKKKDIIISKVKTRIRKNSHKYGIEIPTSVAHAKKIDDRNGNTYWCDAIKKEMFNVGIAFHVLEESENLPGGWSKATGHIIFDVKMDFTRKARWVLDRHRCSGPEGSTYAGVVSRESV